MGASVWLHALGHLGLAVAAGASARALITSLVPTLPVLGAGVAGKEATDLSVLGAPLAAALFGLVSATVKAIFGAHASYAQAQLSAEVGARLRLSLLDAWLEGPSRQFDHGSVAQGGGASSTRSPAQALAALTLHVRDVETGVRVGALGSLRAAAQLLPLGGALVWLSPQFAAVAMLVLAPFGVLLGRLRRLARRAHLRAMHDAEALVLSADEAVRHTDLWRTYGAQRKVRARVEALGITHVLRAARAEGGAALLSGANEALAALALVLAIAAARSGWASTPDGPTLAGFIATFFLAYRPLRDLGDARAAWARATLAFDVLSESLAPIPLAPPPPSRVWVNATLDVRGLSLAHGAARCCSFRLEPGKILAVVGPNGAGKTTLLRTLLGLEAPRAGAITFGGADIVASPAGPESRPFAWVPQEAPLLSDTLTANVQLGGDGDVRASLCQLGVEPLVDALGSDRLGVGGRVVSGGERQCIALARALATRQPVLLLDEPTSGLDAAAQVKVLQAIAALRGRRSVVIVTHRREPLGIADAVIELA